MGYCKSSREVGYHSNHRDHWAREDARRKTNVSRRVYFGLKQYMEDAHVKTFGQEPMVEDTSLPLHIIPSTCYGLSHVTMD